MNPYEGIITKIKAASADKKLDRKSYLTLSQEIADLDGCDNKMKLAILDKLDKVFTVGLLLEIKELLLKGKQ